MEIAKKIIGGERLKPSDDLNFLLTTPLEKLQAGVTGNMLTTSNINIKTDLKLLAKLGLTNKEGDSNDRAGKNQC